MAQATSAGRVNFVASLPTTDLESWPNQVSFP
jgi:hypothetical protein